MSQDACIALVGLGNPGPAYAQTRHNAGFWLVDQYAQRHGASLRAESRFFGEVGRARVGTADVWLLKPQTYMNRSGQAVVALASFYRITADRMLVAHDDLDLPAGAARLKVGGGYGGHNGLRDIGAPLGPAFRRLRIGVGHPGERERVMPYLTHERPRAEERSAIDAAIERAADALDLWLAQTWDKAVQALHTPD